jgi:uncharacterized protein
MRHLVLLLAAFSVSPVRAKPVLPSAIYTDPARDAVHPARMEVLHIPSGDVQINGVAYLAAGAGPHPTVILCHGWPGNEKNLDLAQAMRRAGWNVVTFNYRGSWGSPGAFRFAQNPEDAAAVIAYLRDPANAAQLEVDTRRMVLMGHSMGGWVSALVAGKDSGLIGVGLISAANMGYMRGLDRPGIVKMASENTETLADTSPEIMADELIAGRAHFDFMLAVPGLALKPLLVLSSDDGLAPQTDALVAAVRTAGGGKVTSVHVATDHGWSDRRIRLQVEILNWLANLRPFK